MTDSAVRRMPRRRIEADERGAAMVELALVMPLLILLIFGIIEFGYLFAQHLDVRHGAREGARMAAVDYNPGEYAGTSPAVARLQLDRLVADTCQRMEFAEGAQVTIALVDYTDGTGTQDNLPGDYITVRVTATPRQITGLFGPIIDRIDLDSDVEMRIESVFQPIKAMAGAPLSYSGTCA